MSIRKNNNKTYEDPCDAAESEAMPEVPILGRQIDEQKITSGFVQWVIDGKKFMPMSRTTLTLPCGYYHLGWSSRMEKHFLEKRNILTDKLLHFPSPVFEEILVDIKGFWDKRDLYGKYEFAYKRGILLFGPPGCGKSSLIQLLAKNLIEKQRGIIINVSGPDDIDAFESVMTYLREIEPDRNVIAIIEDIDNFTESRESEVVTKLLNILDGAMKFDRMVIVATTNYPEKLAERVKNRPSRFDKRYRIGLPNSKIRRYYIENMLMPEDLKTIDVDMWVKETRLMTIDHIKELVLSVFVLGYTFEQSMESLRKMMNDEDTDKPQTVKQTTKVGFTNNGGIDAIID